VSNLAVQVLPDAERELVEFLRAQPELAADADRIYTAFPAQAGADSLIIVRRFGGEPKVGRPLVLDEATCQLDIYGGGKGAAYSLAALVRALLADRNHQVVLGPFRYVPDETFSPPRPRYLVDVTYYLRPDAPSAAARRRPDAPVGATQTRDAPGEEV
jgi:hypothetical protein